MEKRYDFNLFASPLIVIQTDEEDHKKIHDEYIDKIYEYKKNSTKSYNSDPHRQHYVSDTNGYTSHYAETLLKNDSFKDLIAYLNTTISKHLCEKENLQSINLQWMDCWFNVYSKHQNVEEHFHPNSIISGVYYLKCPKNCGDIVFFDQLYSFKNYCKNLSRLKTFIYPKKFNLTPKNGMLILFPSWLTHMTNLNMSDEDRIIFSFNIVPGIKNFEDTDLGPEGYFKYFK